MLALYRGVSWMSRLIRWHTRSPYSHAAWINRDGSVIDAWTHGVRIATDVGDDHTPGTPVDLFEPWTPFTDAEALAIEHFLLRQVGHPYDLIGLLRFVSRRAVRVNDRWFCSELCFAALSSVGRAPLARVEAWQVSPGMLAWSPLWRKAGVVLTQGAPRRPDPAALDHLQPVGGIA